jgi:hypothetical protein
MWSQLNHHDIQHKLWRTKKRFALVAAGRGSGKTELARRRIVRYLPIKKPWSNPMYFYALPTYGQAKRVAWEEIKKLVPKHWILGEPKDGEMVIKTIFGSSLYVVGLDKPQRIEGNQWDGGIIDEFSDQRPGVFDKSVRPALSHKTGWCWMIGVPKRFGIGAVEFKDKFYKYMDEAADPDFQSFTWSSEDILSASELESARRNLSSEDYDEQFRASWVSIRGAVYHAFDEVFNVVSEATYKADVPIVVGQDFNVDPMSWVLCHVAANGLVAFDELRINNTNTQASLDILHQKYGHHKAGWIFIGDASGRARKTSATSTDYVIIKNDPRFPNKTMSYTKANPAVEDRNASVNALLCNANKDRRLFVNPRCKWLIRDLTSLSYKPNTREIQLGPGLGHMSDALGYIVYRLFPLRTDHKITSSLVTRG